ncbi:MAG: fatty acid desaturase, partial [Planctomycetota bacterium]
TARPSDASTGPDQPAASTASLDAAVVIEPKGIPAAASDVLVPIDIQTAGPQETAEAPETAGPNAGSNAGPTTATDEHGNTITYEMRKAPLAIRLVNLAAVVIPFLGLIAAIVLLWGTAFNWLYLGLLAGMYILTGLGITVGYHRLFTHRSFTTPKPVAMVFAMLGSMAIEGPMLQWVANHRKHHQHSDHEEDPHSPHAHGGGVIGTLRGLWHAHMGWFLNSHTFVSVKDGVSCVPQKLTRYVKDLEQDRFYRWMSNTFPVWAGLGLAIPAVLGGLITMTWMGALLGFIWGGLVRVLLLHHVTWSINSVCHIWGTQPFKSHDESRNNAIFGVLAMGEGWHNNHHAFPTSARHGLRWWEFDISYLVIKGLECIGLASQVRVPTAERMAAKRAH